MQICLKNSRFPLCIKLIASYVREKVLPFICKRPWVLSLAPQREKEELQPSDCYWYPRLLFNAISKN